MKRSEHTDNSELINLIKMLGALNALKGEAQKNKEESSPPAGEQTPYNFAASVMERHDAISHRVRGGKN